MEELFKDNKKKNIKQIMRKTIFVFLIIAVVSAIIFVIYKYMFEPKVLPGKAETITLAKESKFLNKYFDLEGLSNYLDDINKSSYTFNSNMEVSNDMITKTLRVITGNQTINSNDFKLNFNGKVDKTGNRIQTNLDVDYLTNNFLNLEMLDASGKLMIFGKDFFNEHIGFEKDKIKDYLVKNKKMKDKEAQQLQNLLNVDLDKNVIKEQNLILSSILESIPDSLEQLPDDVFKIYKDVKVNYRNNSHKATKYNISLDSHQYVLLLETLKSNSKNKASMKTIDVKDLIGKTDNLTNYYISYMDSLLNLSLKDKLDINIYNINGNIARIEFVKKTENTNNINTVDPNKTVDTESNKSLAEGSGNNEEKKEVIFELEFNNTINTNEVIISNADFNLKSAITNDNNKIYTKIDLSGQIPIPADIIGELNNPSIKIKPGNEKVQETRGENSNLNSNLELNTNQQQEEQRNNGENQTREETDKIKPQEEKKNQADKLPEIDLTDDKNITKLDESLLTKKIKLEISLSFDRPQNVSDNINFNLKFNNAKINVILKLDIRKKQEVVIENPNKIITLTSMPADRLKLNLDVIYKVIVTKIIQKAKDLAITK